MGWAAGCPALEAGASDVSCAECSESVAPGGRSACAGRKSGPLPAGHLESVGGDESPVEPERIGPRWCGKRVVFEDRSYTEGAVLRVGAVALVCVPASALAADARASVVDGEQISDQQQRYTWAPLNSPRIAAYRKSVGLPPHSSRCAGVRPAADPTRRRHRRGLEVAGPGVDDP